MSALQTRQAGIVKQLEQLRFRLNEMQSLLGINELSAAQRSTIKSTQKSSQKVAQPIDVSSANIFFQSKSIEIFLFYLDFQTKYLQDIIIHVNPANIPYSLLGLQSQWKNRLNLLVDCYTHSSIVELPQQNQEFANRLSQFTPNSGVPTLKVTLIWKDTANTLLVGAPGAFIPISGEVNIIRYLIRIGPSEFGYDNESIEVTLNLDAVLDAVHELLSMSTKHGRTAVLKRLQQRLGKQKAFGGSAYNVSDIAVISALKQLNLNAKDLPANIKTWFDQSTKALNF